MKRDIVKMSQTLLETLHCIIEESKPQNSRRVRSSNHHDGALPSKTRFVRYQGISNWSKLHMALSPTQSGLGTERTGVSHTVEVDRKRSYKRIESDVIYMLTV